MKKYIGITELVNNIVSEEEKNYAIELLKQGAKDRDFSSKYISVDRKGSLKINSLYSNDVKAYLETKGFVTKRNKIVREKMRKVSEEGRIRDAKEAQIIAEQRKTKIGGYNLQDKVIKITLAKREEIIKIIEDEIESNPGKNYAVSEIISRMQVPLKFIQKQQNILGDYSFSKGGYEGKRVASLIKKLGELEKFVTICNIYKPKQAMNNYG